METLADFRLSRRTRRTLTQVAPIVLTEEVIRLGIVDEVLDEVELLLRAMPTALRVGLVAGIEALEQSARAVPSSLGRPFSSLDPELAGAHFARFWESELAIPHQLARGLKMFLAMAYYEHPRVKRQLGYDPEVWIAKVKAERQERFGEELDRIEAELRSPEPLLPKADRAEA